MAAFPGADALTDAEAALLVNKEFGFEASRVVILREAEAGVTAEGARSVKTESVPRDPVYAASDYNYVRFNVYTPPGAWHYEMVNSKLHPVYL